MTDRAVLLGNLDKANEVRSAHKALREQVEAGMILPAAMLLLDPIPEQYATLKIGRLLSWQKGWGKNKTAAFLAPFHPTQPDFVIGPIPHSRRIELAEALRDRE